jgi:KipI family sensor histidine kinase inhibitor
MNNTKPRFLPGGDSTLFIEFDNIIKPEVGRRVWNTLCEIQKSKIPGVIESVPTYKSLLIYYDPLQIEFEELRSRLEILTLSIEDRQLHKPTVTEIPTVYGNEYGPDLEFVARHNELTTEEVITIHTSTTYLIYMLGFIPGFPYLGGMSPKIATPRKKTPRKIVPSGSVGIVGNQTVIYSNESPGGSQLIGRTPIKLFDIGKEPPALLHSQEYITFIRITQEEFVIIQKEAIRGIYQVNRSYLKE